MKSLSSSLSPIAIRACRSLQPLALLAALALCAAVGSWKLSFVPAQDRLLKAETSYEAARQTQARLQTARKTAAELVEVWQALPARKDFAMLSFAISELAQHDQVGIPGMTYTIDKVEDGLAIKASMTFRAAGPYGAIRRFIHRLETTGPYLFIESLDAARSTTGRPLQTDKGHAAPPVVFNVRVVTFLRADPATKPGGV